MSASILYMSMSLDGFIAGPNEGPLELDVVGGKVLEEMAALAEEDRDELD